MLQRKVLLVPYIRCGDKKTRLVVVQHAESLDWTFISGTCEPRERPDGCAIRELFEETLGAVSISRLPANTQKIRIISEGKRIDVYFIPVRKGSQLLEGFKECEQLLAAEAGGANGVGMNENADLKFLTYRQFLRKRIWTFVRNLIDVPIFQERLLGLKISS